MTTNLTLDTRLNAGRGYIDVNHDDASFRSYWNGSGPHGGNDYHHELFMDEECYINNHTCTCWQDEVCDHCWEQWKAGEITMNGVKLNPPSPTTTYWRADVGNYEVCNTCGHMDLCGDTMEDHSCTGHLDVQNLHDKSRGNYTGFGMCGGCDQKRYIRATSYMNTCKSCDDEIPF